jgi:exodeoxyribonuclease III
VIIATYNAAGIRARLPVMLDWLAHTEPDVLAIQETKVEDSKFPIAEFEELGYNVAISGQKSWNGVALLARGPIESVRKGFQDDLFPDDARVIAGQVNGINFVNTYVPNGSAVGTDKFDYKLRWLERFKLYLAENYRPDQPLIWLGDMNIAPTENDVYDPKRHWGKVGFHPDEVARLEAIIGFGFSDLFRMHTQGPGHYTYWDFVILTSVARNLGWRIDHIYATKPVAQACVRCWVDREPRSGDRPSDHTYVLAEIDL